jgi:hypothetical protein
MHSHSCVGTLLSDTAQVVNDSAVWVGSLDLPTATIAWLGLECGGGGPEPRGGMEYARFDSNHIVILSG